MGSSLKVGAYSCLTTAKGVVEVEKIVPTSVYLTQNLAFALVFGGLGAAALFASGLMLRTIIIDAEARGYVIIYVAALLFFALGLWFVRTVPTHLLRCFRSRLTCSGGVVRFEQVKVRGWIRSSTICEADLGLTSAKFRFFAERHGEWSYGVFLDMAGRSQLLTPLCDAQGENDLASTKAAADAFADMLWDAGVVGRIEYSKPFEAMQRAAPSASRA